MRHDEILDHSQLHTIALGDLQDRLRRAAIGKACKILRPQGQMILSHEPLIEGHPRQGQAYSKDEGLYRRPTQAVLEISKRNGMKLRVVKDLVVSHRPGPPVICQLAHLQLR